MKLDQEHLVIQTHDGIAHVIPAVVFEKIAAGEMQIQDVDDYQKIMRVVVGEWLKWIKTKEEK